MEGDRDSKAKTTSSLKNMSRMFGELCTEVGRTMWAVGTMEILVQTAQTTLENLYSGFVEEVTPLISSHPNCDHENFPSELVTNDESLANKPLDQINNLVEEKNILPETPKSISDPAPSDSSSSAKGVGYDSLVDVRCDGESMKSDDFFSGVSDYGNSEKEDSSNEGDEEEDYSSEEEGEEEDYSSEEEVEEEEYSSEEEVKEEEEDSSEGEEEEYSSEGEEEAGEECSSEEEEKKYSSEEEEEEYSSEGEAEDDEEEEYSSEGAVEEEEDSGEEDPIDSICVTKLDMEVQSFEKDLIVFNSHGEALSMLWEAEEEEKDCHASSLPMLWEENEEDRSKEDEDEEEDEYSGERETEEEYRMLRCVEEEEDDDSSKEDEEEKEYSGEGEGEAEEEEYSSEGEAEEEDCSEEQDSSEGERDDNSCASELDIKFKSFEKDLMDNIAPNQETNKVLGNQFQTVQTTLYDELLVNKSLQSHDLVEKRSPKSNEDKEADDDQFLSINSKLKRLEVLISCAEGVHSGISRSQLPPSFCFDESLSKASNVETLDSSVDVRFDGESVKCGVLSSDANYGSSEEEDISEMEAEDEEDSSEWEDEEEEDSSEEYSSKGDAEEEEYSSGMEAEEEEYTSEGEGEDSSEGEEEEEEYSSEGNAEEEEEDSEKGEDPMDDQFPSQNSLLKRLEFLIACAEGVHSGISRSQLPCSFCLSETLSEASKIATLNKTDFSVDASFDGGSVKSCDLSTYANYGRSDDSCEGEEIDDDCAGDLDIEELIKAFEEKLEDDRASDLNIEELIQEFEKELNECHDWVVSNSLSDAKIAPYQETMKVVDNSGGVEQLIPLISTNPNNFVPLTSPSRHEKFPYEAHTIDELLVYMPLEQRYDTNLVPHATTDELVVNMPLRQFNNILEEKNIAPETTPKSNKEEEDTDLCPSPNSVIKGLEDLISCAGVHSVSSVAVHFDDESVRSGDSYPNANYGLSYDSSEGDVEDDCVAEEAFGKEVDDDHVAEEAFGKEVDDDRVAEEAFGKEVDDDRVAEEAFGKEVDDDCVDEEAFEKEVDDCSVMNQDNGNKELVPIIAEEYEAETLVVVNAEEADYNEVRKEENVSFTPADEEEMSDSDWEIINAEEEADYNEVRKEENVRILTRIGRLFR